MSTSWNSKLGNRATITKKKKEKKREEKWWSVQIANILENSKCKYKSKMRKCRNYWSSVWEIISSQKINSEQRSLLSLWEPGGHLHINTNVGEYADDANLIKSINGNWMAKNYASASNHWRDSKSSYFVAINKNVCARKNILIWMTYADRI